LIQGNELAVPINYEAGWDPIDILDVGRRGKINILHPPGIEPFGIWPRAYG